VRCSFISDLHLDSTTPTRIAAFQRFISSEAERADEIYVLGDLTETWVGDDDDSAFAALLREALESAAKRCRLHLMHGNRDFLIGEHFASAAGLHLVEDPYVIERNGVRLLLSHGDAFCTDDVEYQKLRATVRSKDWQDRVLTMALSERRALADSMRAQSRATNANKPSNIMDADGDAIASALRFHNADAVVHGHTHRPGISIVRTADRDRFRYVLGDWDRCGWVLRFADDFNLLRFPLAGHYEI